MKGMILLFLATVTLVSAQTRQPEVWMGPPMKDEGRSFRALFAHPEQWAETRSLIDVLFCTDLHTKKIFSDDDELRRIFTQMKAWKLKFGMEVGAIKPWGLTGADCFAKEKPLWDRVQKPGGEIYAIAMDEPLVCGRFHLKKSDEYVIEETANYIACVRTNFPNIRIGDIEVYPSISIADDSTWYTAIMQQGYDYAFIDGKPDQYVIESWISAPGNCVPETAEFTFTRSVRDFARKFVKRAL
jgi:hypothetical protein